MLCLTCAEVEKGSARFCLRCGAQLVTPSLSNIRRFGDRKLRVRLNDWRRLGLLDDALLAALEATLPPVEPHPSRPSSPRLGRPTAPERHRPAPEPAPPPEVIALGATPITEPAVEAVARRVEPAAEPPPETAVEAAVMVEATRGVTGAVGGVDAFAALDEQPVKHGSRSFALQTEYVFWFIGSVLVLGGSVFGVREAWLALGGAWRQLLVSSALFAYHAGFVGMAAVVARRSAAAGRVLSAIAVGLLPVVFVALGAMVAVSPGLGLLSAAVMSALVAFTLLVTAGRFEGVSSFTLWLTLFPALEAELLVGAFPGSAWLRLALPLVGVASVWWTVRRDFTGPSLAPAGVPVLGFATFGAVALLAVDVLGALVTADGSAGLDAVTWGSVPLASLLLGALLLMTQLAEAAAQESSRTAYPRAAGVLEVFFLAATSALALAVAVPFFSGTVAAGPMVGLTSVVTVLLSALLVGRLEARRPPVLHLAIVLGALSTALVAALARPTEPAWWAFGAAVMAPATMALASSAEGKRRNLLMGWSIALGVGAFITAAVTDTAVAALGSWPPTTATAVLVGGFAHLTAGRRIHPLHSYGGLALLAALVTWAWLLPGPSLLPLALGLAVQAAVYRGLGLASDLVGTRTSEDTYLRPFDDLALMTAVGALGVMAFVLGATGAGVFSYVASPAWTWAPALATASLFVGAQRDRSRVVSVLAVLGLDLFALVVAQATASARSAMVHGVVALGAVWVAHVLRPSEVPTSEERRRFFGVAPLPAAASGRRLYADGFAVAAMFVAVFGGTSLVGWLTNQVEADRGLGIEAGLVLVAAALSAFFSKGFAVPKARGATATLFVGGAFIALTAVVNRIGRPLPPEVVGRNLTLIAVALWGFALVLDRIGPKLASWLDNPDEGTSYRHAPLVGTLALAGVLGVDALFLGAPFSTTGWVRTPPLFFLGSALALTLLARAWKATVLLDAALALTLPGAALLATQKQLLGPSLVALPGPVGVWVRAGAEAVCAAQGLWSTGCALEPGVLEPAVWNDAALGLASATLAFAVLALMASRGGAGLLVKDAGPLVTNGAKGALLRWAGVGAALVCAWGFALSHVSAAGLVLASGVVLVFARDRHAAARQVALGGVLVVHAVATAQPTLPLWPGPVLAALALVPSLPFVAKDPNPLATPRRALVVLVLVLAAVDAFATGAAQTPVWVGANLLGAALQAVGDGTFLVTLAVPATLALAAVALLLASMQVRRPDSWPLGAAAPVVMALAVAGALAHDALEGQRWLSALPSSLLFARGAFALAVGTAFAQAGAWWADRLEKRDGAKGVRFGRDALFAGLSAWMPLFASLAATLPGARLFETTLVTLVLAVGVAVHAAWTEQTARHVYFVEGAVLGGYAIARSQALVTLTPQVDALVVLALGFFLVGVTVLARRFGAPPVATATRRFTAALPLLMPFVLGGNADGGAAVVALGSSALYGALAAVERSRWLGSLAATAANVALLLWALWLGLRGAEVYLAPLGLLLMALGHLFSKDLSHGSRNALRVVGGLLLYVPSGLNVTLQLAQGSEGLYSVAFGAVCLGGMVVGVLLQIRAYLALGALFLVLEVGTTLVYASLRDHRIAFVVLSAAGLLILGAMIAFTLKREAITGTLAAARHRLRGWD